MGFHRYCWQIKVSVHSLQRDNQVVHPLDQCLSWVNGHHWDLGAAEVFDVVSAVTGSFRVSPDDPETRSEPAPKPNGLGFGSRVLSRP